MNLGDRKANHILSQFSNTDDLLEKGKKTGPGSRGGKITGYTKSGKPIYGGKNKAQEKSEKPYSPKSKKTTHPEGEVGKPPKHQKEADKIVAKKEAKKNFIKHKYGNNTKPEGNNVVRAMDILGREKPGFIDPVRNSTFYRVRTNQENRDADFQKVKAVVSKAELVQGVGVNKGYFFLYIPKASPKENLINYKYGDAREIEKSITIDNKEYTIEKAIAYTALGVIDVNDLEKALPVGHINAHGKQKQSDGTWKYVKKGKSKKVEKNPKDGKSDKKPVYNTKSSETVLMLSGLLNKKDAKVTITKNGAGDPIVKVNGESAFNLNDKGMYNAEDRKRALNRAYEGAKISKKDREASSKTPIQVEVFNNLGRRTFIDLKNDGKLFYDLGEAKTFLNKNKAKFPKNAKLKGDESNDTTKPSLDQLRSVGQEVFDSVYDGKVGDYQDLLQKLTDVGLDPSQDSSSWMQNGLDDAEQYFEEEKENGKLDNSKKELDIKIKDLEDRAKRSAVATKTAIAAHEDFLAGNISYKEFKKVAVDATKDSNGNTNEMFSDWLDDQEGNNLPKSSSGSLSSALKDEDNFDASINLEGFLEENEESLEENDSYDNTIAKIESIYNNAKSTYSPKKSKSKIPEGSYSSSQKKQADKVAIREGKVSIRQ